MHDRHTNRERYFREQAEVTERFIIPYIETVLPLHKDLVIAEIGCGEAGNMMPFLNMGCKVVGIDLSESKIENGKEYYKNHPNVANLLLVAEDIYKVNPEDYPKFDLVVMRDVIEHIPNQEEFMKRLRDFMKPQGKIFFGFPPWCMPFGGHQQVSPKKMINRFPYHHLFPRFAHIGLLKLAKEDPERIKGFMEIRDTKISSYRFFKICKRNNFKVLKWNMFFINPGYEVKFNLKTRKLFPLFNFIPIRDFLSTACYAVIEME